MESSQRQYGVGNELVFTPTLQILHRLTGYLRYPKEHTQAVAVLNTTKVGIKAIRQRNIKRRAKSCP